MTGQPNAARAAQPRPSWWRERWDEPGTIYFWSGHQGPHRAFSNFNEDDPFPMPCWLEPTLIVEMPDGEHGFQTAKGTTMADFRRILSAKGPLAAKRAGGPGKVRLPPDWNQRRPHVMLAVVRARVAHIASLRELLLATGEHLLAEDSPYDSLWGCRDRCGGYTGQNLLGRAFMRVRADLREGADSAPRPPA
jgi:hypothetical protein